MRTSRYESHKVLGKNIENDLAVLEDAVHCNVLFEDRGSNQLYSIAHTEDEDYRNTNQNLINMVQDKITKISAMPKHNKKMIAEEKKRVK